MLNNLSIRNKIILILLFPVLGLLLLSSFNISDKWSKQQQIKQTQELVNLGQALDHLAHNMAVERGLSAGFLGSKGTQLGDKVKEQRQLVDEAVARLQQFLSRFEHKDAAVEERTIQLLQQVEMRDTIRTAIDALAPDNGGFAYYSATNTQALEIIDRISGMVSEGTLARQLRALSAALWIKERIGQERGMMNGLFARGLYNDNKMLTVRGFIADQAIYLKGLESNIAANQKLLWEEKQSQFDQKRYQEMRDVIFSKGKKVALITRLQSVIGYGGLIHNFKNYVLRKRPRERRMVIQNYKAAMTILEELSTLPGTTDRERERISDIHYVLGDYNKVLELAKKQKIKGEEMEKLIKIIDRPALMAIKALATQIEGVEASEWFQLATQRIGIFKGVGDQISSDISDHTRELVNATRLSLLMNASLTLLVLIVVFLLGVAISRRLIGGVQAVGTAMNTIATDGHFDHQVNVDGEDELGQMAESINNHLRALKGAIDEVGTVMQTASQGDYGSRIDSDLPGDLGVLKGHINSSMEATQHALKAVNEVMAGVARGEFHHRVNNEGQQGELALFGNNVNEAVASLQRTSDGLSSVMQAIVQGNFTYRMDSQVEGEIRSNVDHAMEAMEAAISEISAVMKQVADGNLSSSIQGQYPGQLKTVSDAINNTLSNLQHIVSEVRNVVTGLNHGIEEITVGNEELSHRTSSQAASLEETAASMEEMSSTVRHNADNASQANNLSKRANSQASEGVEVLERTIQAMEEITSSSQKMTDIINLIDSIAFQTNLLALNAAVESARAGEHGRGFAVVANEVRTLAQRAADATREISTLIDESNQHVKEGSRLVNESGESLESIRLSVAHVNDIMSEIASASGQQSNGIEQVNTAVTQLDAVNQRNSALVEETAAASRTLLEQSESLEKLIGFFNTGGGNRQP